MSLKEKFDIELEKLKKMSARDKAGYIWEYYKFWIIGIIGCAFLLYGIIDTQIQNSKDSFIHITLINSNLSGSEEPSLMEDFAAYAGVNLDDVKSTLDTSIRMTPDMKDEYSINCSAKMMAQIGSKALDVTVMDRQMFDFYAGLGSFHKLDKVIPPDFYETYKEYFITGKDADGEEYICGLDLSSSIIFQRVKAYQDTPYLSIIGNTENLDTALLFVEYLYSENQEKE